MLWAVELRCQNEVVKTSSPPSPLDYEAIIKLIVHEKDSEQVPQLFRSVCFCCLLTQGTWPALAKIETSTAGALLRDGIVSSFPSLTCCHSFTKYVRLIFVISSDSSGIPREYSLVLSKPMFRLPLLCS